MNMTSKLNYTKVGDYQLPNLTLPLPQSEMPLGRYGRMRRTYLMQEHPTKYNVMLLNGTLYPHLSEVQKTAELWLLQMEQMSAPYKETNQMMWVGHMNALKNQIEEKIRAELIYS